MIKEVKKKFKQKNNNFDTVKIFLRNISDFYEIDPLINVTIPFKGNFFFEITERSFVAAISCYNIKKILKKYGNSIFQKNIRGYLGKNKKNEEIINTLKNNPKDFFMLNNGLTIIGDKIETPDSSNIFIENIQIINGQQTSLKIKESGIVEEDDCHILCRFFQISEPEKVKKITETTNTQNPTKERDFVSNDDIQKAIQEHFYKKDIFYERKSKEKIPIGLSNVEKISNKKFGQAILGTILGKPSKIRIPKESVLFTDHKDQKNKKIGFYDEIFSNMNLEDAYLSYKLAIDCKKKSNYDNSTIKKDDNKKIEKASWLHIARIIWFLKEEDKKNNRFEKKIETQKLNHQLIKKYYKKSKKLVFEFIKDNLKIEKNDFNNNSLNKGEIDDKLTKYLKSKVFK